MAYKEMTNVIINSSEKGQYIYEYQDSVNIDNTAGVSIIIPAGTNFVGVSVKVGTGATVRVEACTDAIADVKSDSVNNTWIVWDKGNVTANAQDGLSTGATAVRLYCVTAGSTTSTIKVSAK